MTTGTARRFNAIGKTAEHLAAMPSTRLIKLTLGWGITLCGTLVLVSRASASIAPFYHHVASVITQAMM
ncbi:hypothetical protein PQQ53_04610 [Paraburkholderia strydomiana]|jgi:hypothetical protein|uniref:Uncharacterized protein n=1 Tax=Paraburkholderia strydomiana TaxID=1245417 RepID=A0ABW9E9E5_9BURK